MDIVHLGGFQPEGSREPGGGWRWVTDEPFMFTNWSSINPNNSEFGIPEAFLTFCSAAQNGTWNDVRDFEQTYIIEYDTEP